MRMISRVIQYRFPPEIYPLHQNKVVFLSPRRSYSFSEFYRKNNESRKVAVVMLVAVGVKSLNIIINELTSMDAYKTRLIS